MLVVDELKKNEPQLRLVALMLAVGFAILLGGLWWIQIVSAREFKSNLETQSNRTIRLPAVRGKILDREGRVLAENQPRYNLCLYLDDLRGLFKKEYYRLKPVKVVTNAPPAWKFWDHTQLVETQRVRLSSSQVEALNWQARFNVARAVTDQLGQQLGQPIYLNPTNFSSHYVKKRVLPYPALENLNVTQIARFQEQGASGIGVDLGLESVRRYPNGTTAGHLLGYVRSNEESQEGETAYFDYPLQDYRGVVGVEAGFDALLRGRAGEESVQINSSGYRQSKTITLEPEPGHNIVLTLDLELQRAAENAVKVRQGANARAAVVIMDVRNGDVLAMVSSPAINPVYAENDRTRLADETLRPAINRATQENYAPGSVFKVVVGLAALEAGLNPEKNYAVQPDPTRPGKGCIFVGKRKIEDTVAPGDYNFKRALVQSSNAYFVTNGLRTGIDRIVVLAQKLQFGRRADLPTRQETRGELPTLERVHHDWSAGDTANLTIGQGELAVTPLQVAIAYSAIANGGTVFWPRLVTRVMPQDPASREVATNFPTVVRDRIGVSGRSLRVLHDAMLAETEDDEGTGQAAVVPGLRICGKTGTAQRQDSAGRMVGWNYWFASFAPYESPRYAVVVLVQSEGKGSGGSICAPIAHDIYAAILKKENRPAPVNLAGTR